MFTDKQKQSFNDAIMDVSRAKRLDAATKWLHENAHPEHVFPDIHKPIVINNMLKRTGNYTELEMVDTREGTPSDDIADWYKDDPAGFIEELFGLRLVSWQRDLVENCLKRVERPEDEQPVAKKAYTIEINGSRDTYTAFDLLLSPEEYALVSLLQELSMEKAEKAKQEETSAVMSDAPLDDYGNTLSVEEKTLSEDDEQPEHLDINSPEPGRY